MYNLSHDVCRFYDVKPKYISDKKLFRIMEYMLIHFSQITINAKTTNNSLANNLAESFTIAVPQPEESKEEYIDEPFECKDTSLRDAFLNILLDERCLDDQDFYSWVHFELQSPFEKIKQLLIN